MSVKKQTKQASPSQVDDLLKQNGQESQEVELSPDEPKVEDFLSGLDSDDRGLDGEKVLMVGKEDVTNPNSDFQKIPGLPKYDYLKINVRFLDCNNVGQIFKINNATGQYDKIIEEVKTKYDILIAAGYEIHSRTSIQSDYILFTFCLPDNDKAASK